MCTINSHKSSGVHSADIHYYKTKEYTLNKANNNSVHRPGYTIHVNPKHTLRLCGIIVYSEIWYNVLNMFGRTLSLGTAIVYFDPNLDYFRHA